MIAPAAAGTALNNERLPQRERKVRSAYGLQIVSMKSRIPCIALCAAIRALAANSPAIVPEKVVALFDGKSLEAFGTWLPEFKDKDPDRVFSVVEQIDGAPAIRICGQHWGGLITKQRYRDYRLVAEFRWGLLSWGVRKLRARDSGILPHCEGEPGSHRPDFSSPWMKSIEYQVIEGGTGDIIIVPGVRERRGERIFPSLKVRTAGPDDRTWVPNGTLHTYSQGRLNWFGRDPGFKDELGFRGPHDVERPVGEWNRIEVICVGDRLRYYLNGKIVNEAEECSLTTEGKLLFQSEGAEIFFRRIELHPLEHRRKVGGTSSSTTPAFPFQRDEGWRQRLAAHKLEQVSAIATDSRGFVYVAHRGERPLLRFHADGRLDREIGGDVHRRSTRASADSTRERHWLHGLHVDRSDNVWVTDVGRHIVLKFDPDERLPMTLGEDRKPGEDERHFKQPTAVCVVPAGDVFVADGYGNSRVVRFDCSGRYKAEAESPSVTMLHCVNMHAVVQGSSIDKFLYGAQST